MEKTYEPHAIERQCYQIWEEKAYFKPADKGTLYCMMMPPPNVTGSLHMEHGFNNAVMVSGNRLGRHLTRLLKLI